MNAESGYQCTECGKTFRLKCALKAHIRIHTGERPFQCPTCPCWFRQSAHLRVHVRTHTGERPYQCSVCGKAFGNGSHLRAHMRIHSTKVEKQKSNIDFTENDYQPPPLYETDNLSKNADDSKRNFTSKKSSQQDSGERFMCELCCAIFKSKHHLKNHLLTHTGYRPHVCTQCNKAFTQASHLREHLLTHKYSSSHICKVCMIQCRSATQAREHAKSHRKNATKDNVLYKCSVCDKNFRKLERLKTHMQRHTGEKIFKCGICSRNFGESAFLVSHMRTHSGEKPFLCHICPKNFAHRSILRCHLKMHAGDKKYCCEVCDKKFISQSDVVKHSRVHTREKPFVCQFCNSCFRRSNHLSRHVKIHFRTKSTAEPTYSEDCTEANNIEFPKSDIINSANINPPNCVQTNDSSCALTKVTDCPTSSGTEFVLPNPTQIHSVKSLYTNKIGQPLKEGTGEFLKVNNLFGYFETIERSSMKTVYPGNCFETNGFEQQKDNYTNYQESLGLEQEPRLNYNGQISKYNFEIYDSPRFQYEPNNQTRNNCEKNKEDPQAYTQHLPQKVIVPIPDVKMKLSYRWRYPNTGAHLKNSCKEVSNKTINNSKPWQCGICDVSFKEQSQLKEHIIDHKNDINTVKYTKLVKNPNTGTLEEKVVIPRNKLKIVSKEVVVPLINEHFSKDKVTESLIVLKQDPKHIENTVPERLEDVKEHQIKEVLEYTPNEINNYRNKVVEEVPEIREYSGGYIAKENGDYPGEIREFINNTEDYPNDGRKCINNKKVTEYISNVGKPCNEMVDYGSEIRQYPRKVDKCQTEMRDCSSNAVPYNVESIGDIREYPNTSEKFIHPITEFSNQIDKYPDEMVNFPNEVREYTSEDREYIAGVVGYNGEVREHVSEIREYIDNIRDYNDHQEYADENARMFIDWSHEQQNYRDTVIIERQGYFKECQEKENVCEYDKNHVVQTMQNYKENSVMDETNHSYLQSEYLQESDVHTPDVHHALDLTGNYVFEHNNTETLQQNVSCQEVIEAPNVENSFNMYNNVDNGYLHMNNFHHDMVNENLGYVYEQETMPGNTDELPQADVSNVNNHLLENIAQPIEYIYEHKKGFLAQRMSLMQNENIAVNNRMVETLNYDFDSKENKNSLMNYDMNETVDNNYPCQFKNTVTSNENILSESNNTVVENEINDTLKFLAEKDEENSANNNSILDHSCHIKNSIGEKHEPSKAIEISNGILHEYDMKVESNEYECNLKKTLKDSIQTTEDSFNINNRISYDFKQVDSLCQNKPKIEKDNNFEYEQNCAMNANNLNDKPNNVNFHFHPKDFILNNDNLRFEKSIKENVDCKYGISDMIVTAENDVSTNNITIRIINATISSVTHVGNNTFSIARNDHKSNGISDTNCKKVEKYPVKKTINKSVKYVSEDTCIDDCLDNTLKAGNHGLCESEFNFIQDHSNDIMTKNKKTLLLEEYNSGPILEDSYDNIDSIPTVNPTTQELQDSFYSGPHNNSIKKEIKTESETDNEKLTCYECKKVCRNSNALKIHLQSHSLERPFSCPECPSKFLLRGHLNEHINTHFGSKVHQCEMCGKTFKNASHLKCHMTTHSNLKKYKCDKCPKTYRFQVGLNIHQATHAMDTTYKCEQCGKGFRHPTTLISHQRTHTGIKPYQCSVCLEAFSQISTLTKHMRIHNDSRPHVCSQCSKGFRSANDLNRHIMSHTSIKNFACVTPGCLKTFRRKTHLQRHMSTHRTVDGVT